MLTYHYCLNVLLDFTEIVESFQIGTERRFDDDPRFGLVVLSEIAGRALSPSVNDPGTAIEIVGRLVRLFHLWCAEEPDHDNKEPKYDRVGVPPLSVQDMFDDAFTVISRDGAGHVEVGVRLQKAFNSLELICDENMRTVVGNHRSLALKRASVALDLSEDQAKVRNAANFDSSKVHST